MSDLGQGIKRFLSDIDFMAKYWYALLNYLEYNPMPIKLYIAIFKAKGQSIKYLDIPLIFVHI